MSPNVIPDIVFGTGLLLDLLVPACPPPWPLVIFVHGGGWSGGSRRIAPANEPLGFITKLGIAVASIDYRLSHQAVFPAQLDDLRAALAWIATEGQARGIDPHRVALLGFSAGGRLAPWAVAARCHAAPGVPAA